MQMSMQMSMQMRRPAEWREGGGGRGGVTGGASRRFFTSRNGVKKLQKKKRTTFRSDEQLAYQFDGIPLYWIGRFGKANANCKPFVRVELR